MGKIIVSTICFFMMSGAALAKYEKNISECIKLLPRDGKQYNLSANTVIDKYRKQHGSLFVTDASHKKMTPGQWKIIVPFSECVEKLME